jgi:hypothetical protein
MTAAQQLTPWKPPRVKPELEPARVEQAQEYMSWFVNRRAYTRQKDNPDRHAESFLIRKPMRAMSSDLDTHFEFSQPSVKKPGCGIVGIPTAGS